MHSVPDHRRWNHNTHYQPQLLAAIPPHARTALDIGCGEGYTARALARKGLAVTGIDADAKSIERAREQDSEAITYIEGDVLSTPLARDSFDVVTAIAVVHHMDLEVGLTRMRELVAPGGCLLVLGLARSSLPRDALREVAAVALSTVYRWRREYWEHHSPTVWPPPHSFDQVREQAARILPGSRYRRKVLWRYSIAWTKPLDEAAR